MRPQDVTAILNKVSRGTGLRRAVRESVFPRKQSMKYFQDNESAGYREAKKIADPKWKPRNG